MMGGGRCKGVPALGGRGRKLLSGTGSRGQGVGIRPLDSSLLLASMLLLSLLQ